MSEKKKVIILTLPLENNYGGIMQAYALQKVVADMGYDVVTDCHGCKNISWKGYLVHIKRKLLAFIGIVPIAVQKKIYRNQDIQKFIDVYINTVDFFKGHRSPSKKDIDTFDIFIVGSDQVWRRKYVWVQSYLLAFLRNREEKTKIAYAASFGLDNIDEWSPEDIQSGREMLPLFHAVSVREKSALHLIRNLFDTDSTWVLDPAMLLDKQEYLSINGVKEIAPRRKLLFCYVLDLTEDKKKVIEQIKEKHSIEEVLYISTRMETIDHNLPDSFTCPSVAEWISGFRDADFVFTDSFHGSVFSILFNRQFVCYANKSRGLSRMETLFETFGIMDWLVFDSNDFAGIGNKKIDFQDINSTLQEKREESLCFLKCSLTKR